MADGASCFAPPTPHEVNEETDRKPGGRRAAARRGGSPAINCLDDVATFAGERAAPEFVDGDLGRAAQPQIDAALANPPADAGEHVPRSDDSGGHVAGQAGVGERGESRSETDLASVGVAEQGQMDAGGAEGRDDAGMMGEGDVKAIVEGGGGVESSREGGEILRPGEAADAEGQIRGVMDAAVEPGDSALSGGLGLIARISRQGAPEGGRIVVAENAEGAPTDGPGVAQVVENVHREPLIAGMAHEITGEGCEIGLDAPDGSYHVPIPLPVSMGVEVGDVEDRHAFEPTRQFGMEDPEPIDGFGRTKRSPKRGRSRQGCGVALHWASILRYFGGFGSSDASRGFAHSALWRSAAMAKMFYTLEEAAEKLGKSQDEVREMSESGQLQEFRDRDKLMFKVDQVDLLSSDEGGDAADMSSMIPLADDLGKSDDSGDDFDLDLGDDDEDSSSSGEAKSSEGAAQSGALSLEESAGGSALDMDEPSLGDSGEPSGSSGPGGSSGAGDSKGKSGISIFDADDLEEADPSAVTQVSDEGGMGELSLENVGSGSGLMDLTRESDDTSLGADAFLDDIMTEGEGSMAGAAQPAPTSDLFEGGDDDAAPAMASPGGGMVMAEQYDGAGSGLVGGLCFGAVLALMIGMLAVVTGMMGVRDGGLSAMLADQYMIVVGALAGVTLIAGVLGLVLGKRS